MKTNWVTFIVGVFLILVLLSSKMYAQETTIKDLHFLLGVWQAEEHNKETTYWEKCTRTGTYVLDSTYIQLESVAVSSTGKKRTYRFMIHYDKTAKQFEMICMYSNWPKVQIDFLDWNKETKTITIRNKPETEEYRERVGSMQFSADYSSYIWTGTNKSGERLKPRIWVFEENGKRIE
jgi:hypothetical protein